MSLINIIKKYKINIYKSCIKNTRQIFVIANIQIRDKYTRLHSKYLSLKYKNTKKKYITLINIKKQQDRYFPVPYAKTQEKYFLLINIKKENK